MYVNVNSQFRVRVNPCPVQLVKNIYEVILNVRLK